MILSCHDAESEDLANGKHVGRFAAVEDIARRKIRQLEIANRLEDLRVPLANHLEPVADKRASHYRVRIFSGLTDGYWLRAQTAYDAEIAADHRGSARRRIGGGW